MVGILVAVVNAEAWDSRVGERDNILLGGCRVCRQAKQPYAGHHDGGLVERNSQELAFPGPPDTEQTRKGRLAVGLWGLNFVEDMFDNGQEDSLKRIVHMGGRSGVEGLGHSPANLRESPRFLVP